MPTGKRPAKRRGIGEIVTRRRPDGGRVREYYRRDEVVEPPKEDEDAGTKGNR